MLRPLTNCLLKRNMKMVSVILMCLLSFCVGSLFGVSFMNMDTNSYNAFEDCKKCNKNKLFNAYSSSKTARTDERSDVVIIIVSAPSHFDRRKIIRDTWAKDLHIFNFSYLFSVGTFGINPEHEISLTKEQLRHKDLMLLPHVKEHYNLLTVKVLEMFVWLNNNTNIQQRLILKCDDDSFVNVKELSRSPVLKTKDKLIYWGYFSGKAPVFRKGKWKESQWNMCDHYVPYARGGGYIVSRDIVKFLAANAHIFSVYGNEDVSMGLWLAPLNITRRHDVNFDTEHKSRGCRNSYIVTHPHNEASMRKMHKSLTETGKLCLQAETVRQTYAYNWSVLPSQCCDNFI